MNSRATLSTFALLLLALGCDRATPTAPKDAVLTLTVNPSEISQTETATVTVQAVKSTGLPVNTGSEIQLTTTLGVLGKGIITTDDRGALKNLDRDLKAVVFGQDKAIDALAKAIKMARSGLGNPGKPIGSFLFSGPTGVGKTEVAKQLAYCMGVELQRFDMSEYMERHAVSRLIGAPPGYVGFDQGGLLTEAITKKPYCVLLLDEIEKAHPDIFNILLQVMDHGTLTDNNGRKADFRNAVLIMTSNVGARELSAQPIGFGSAPGGAGARQAVEKTFSPEFRNRLDAIIPFHALTPKVMGRVVDKFVGELQQQLSDQGVLLLLSAAARADLVKRGFDPVFGARPLARLIQRELGDVLAGEILFGRLSKGGRVRIGCRLGKLSFDFG